MKKIMVLALLFVSAMQYRVAVGAIAPLASSDFLTEVGLGWHDKFINATPDTVEVTVSYTGGLLAPSSEKFTLAPGTLKGVRQKGSKIGTVASVNGVYVEVKSGNGPVLWAPEDWVPSPREANMTVPVYAASWNSNSVILKGRTWVVRGPSYTNDVNKKLERSDKSRQLYLYDDNARKLNAWADFDAGKGAEPSFPRPSLFELWDVAQAVKSPGFNGTSFPVRVYRAGQKSDPRSAFYNSKTQTTATYRVWEE